MVYCWHSLRQRRALRVEHDVHNAFLLGRPEIEDSCPNSWSKIKAGKIGKTRLPLAGPSDSYEVTDKTKVKRLKDRGTYDRKTVHAILDEAFIAHVGFVKDGYPLVLPMGYARDGETLLLHGSITNAMLKNMKVCLILLPR